MGFYMAGPWRELYNKMVEDMQSPAFRRFGSYGIAGRTFSYRSLDEFRRHLEWVRREAEKEEGKPSYRARVSVCNGGRGYLK